MEMEVLELAEELGELGKNTRRRMELERLLDVSEDSFVKTHHPKPEPKEMTEAFAPSKKRFIKTGIFFTVCLVISIFMLIGAVRAFSMKKKIDAIKEDPGEEYLAWLNSFGEVATFDDLEDGWESVEKAWKKRGLTVKWDFVKQIKESINSDIIYANRIDSRIFEDLLEKQESVFVRDTMILVILFIPTLISGINTKARWGEFKSLQESYEFKLQKNEEIRQYNENEFPELLEEWEKKLVDVKKEYQESIQAVRDELKIVEQNIEARAHLLPKYYHYDAVDIALILVRGRADSLKEAINIFEEDQRAEELARIERERAADEARHRQAMENEARRAAEQAHRDALAQQQMMRDQMVAEQRARDSAAREAKRQADAQAAAERQARSNALQRCSRCANYNACGNARGIPNCGSFRPR